ncbi:MAG: chorismate-binding protein [Flavobacteriales bacterium]|nr:chorismate-binding protein [Flavobacteriales bacterium]
MDQTFVVWKAPEDTQIKTVSDPEVIIGSDINFSEGFLIAPYENSASKIFMKGKIQNLELPEIMDNYKSSNIRGPVNDVSYQEVVQKAVRRIDAGEFQKVVLARVKKKTLPKEFRVSDLFGYLVSHFPGAFVYCFGVKGEIWIGATPEVLIQSHKNSYVTYALAGTKSYQKKSEFGSKENKEQSLVRNYILQKLNELNASNIEVSPLREHNTGNLIHLINQITFNHSDVQKVINSLHPTPAVCGYPLKEAEEFIRENEGIEREYYSGFLGPVYTSEKVNFWVNLRCLKTDLKNLIFWAGAGIVKGSMAEEEYSETELKMSTLEGFFTSEKPM